MPSIKMKAKSSPGCLREKHVLRVCQKSSVISKKACSHLRVSDEADELDGYIAKCLEGKKLLASFFLYFSLKCYLVLLSKNKFLIASVV